MLPFATRLAHEYLAAEGMTMAAEDGPVDAVFVAHADTVDFPLLERAARAVIAGAPLLTASYVPAYAGANGPILSRGAMTTAAIAKASSTEPVIVGKPSLAALRTIESQVGVRTDEIVDDRRRRDDGHRPGPHGRRDDRPRHERHQRPRRPRATPGANTARTR